jgi:hypothetical protein
MSQGARDVSNVNEFNSFLGPSLTDGHINA